MESIEQWMWFVAGILMTAIIVVSAFSLLSNHIKATEISQAKDSFSILAANVQEVCLQGKNFEMTKTLTFPNTVETIRADSGETRELCMKIKEESESCQEIGHCL